MNFAIYSCNWTKKDFKFKKLVLLAMRMNDASQIIIRATPKKIINLQMFASVLICYFITYYIGYNLCVQIMVNVYMVLGHDDMLQHCIRYGENY